jgi:hypothetical protein
MSHLWDAFRLTSDDWNKIFIYQNKCCFICQKPQGKVKFHVDHSHKSGLVRGLLCSQCNRALGKIEDPRWQWTAACVYRAFRYLISPPAVSALGRKVYGFPGRIGTKRYRQWKKRNKQES